MSGVDAGNRLARARDGRQFGGAKECQHDGWKTLVRSDDSSFKNQGECVSYAAHGGTFGAPAEITSVSQIVCNAGTGTGIFHVTGTGFSREALITFTASDSPGTAGNFLNEPPGVHTDASGAFDSGTFGSKRA